MAYHRRNCVYMVKPIVRGENMLQTPNNIRAVTARDLRNNFKKIADDINDYDTTVIVARPKDKNVVIISQKEYDSWQETSYLLGTKANRDALAEATQSFENQDQRNKVLTPEEFEALTQNDEA